MTFFSFGQLQLNCGKNSTFVSRAKRRTNERDALTIAEVIFLLRDLHDLDSVCTYMSGSDS